jgi:hypothetical protein
LIGSLAAGAFAAGFAGAAFAGSLVGVGAGLACPITIGTEMILRAKTKTINIASFLIILLLSCQKKFCEKMNLHLLISSVQI